jgi:hypothetical protein
MNGFRLSLSCIITMSLLLSSFIGTGRHWACTDPDGAVSFENEMARNECCTKHGHAAATSVRLSLDTSCCHDVELSAVKLSVTTERLVSFVKFAPEILSPDFRAVVSTKLSFLNQPERPEIHLGRDAPALLATIILIV